MHEDFRVQGPGLASNRAALLSAYRVFGPLLLIWPLLGYAVGSENQSPCPDGWPLCEIAVAVGMMVLYGIMFTLPVITLFTLYAAFALRREWTFALPCWLFLLFVLLTISGPWFGKLSDVVGWLLVFSAGLAATRLGYRRTTQ